MPSFSRQQIIAWSVVGLVILLIGANYLRGQIPTGTGPAASVMTVGLKEAEEKNSRIKVHVSGAVVRPGLYELDGGTRIADALALAGGPAPDADLNQINLAAKLADGQQVAVPRQGSSIPAPGIAAGGSAGISPAAGQPLNLNSATAGQLEQLDGIGPKTAQKIIEFRETQGGFRSVEDLLQVPGIGPAKFDQIKDQVCV